MARFLCKEGVFRIRGGAMTWDKGLDYEEVYSKILRTMSKNKRRTKCYDAILLLQLRNGARISEATNAFLEYLKGNAKFHPRTKKLIVTVRVAKKKKPEERMIVIPEDLKDVDLSECKSFIDDPFALKKRVIQYAREKYGFNTHSLRFAFITYLLLRGNNPSIVAKITKHSKLDYILHYTEEKKAEDALLND
jgi:integrase